MTTAAVILQKSPNNCPVSNPVKSWSYFTSGRLQWL